MTPGEPLVRLRHGTTRQRAEAILRNGPDPGGLDRAEGFSAARLTGSFLGGSPEAVAAEKAKLFPAEGGPAILEIEVPESLVRKADLGSEVRFHPGYGLEELLAIWPLIPKRIFTP